jgi:hypothetical protein
MEGNNKGNLRGKSYLLFDVEVFRGKLKEKS